MAAIASIVNGPLENTSVEINKMIGICEGAINQQDEKSCQWVFSQLDCFNGQDISSDDNWQNWTISDRFINTVMIGNHRDKENRNFITFAKIVNSFQDHFHVVQKIVLHYKGLRPL